MLFTTTYVLLTEREVQGLYTTLTVCKTIILPCDSHMIRACLHGNIATDNRRCTVDSYGSKGQLALVQCVVCCLDDDVEGVTIAQEVRVCEREKWESPS